MKHRRTAVLVVLGLLAAAGSAWAHHSLQSEYDIEKSITLKGTITRVEWVNPHVYLYLDVKGADGKLHQKNLGKIDQVKDPCKANKVGPCASGS